MKTHTKAFYGALLAVLILATPLAAQARPFGHGYGPGHAPGDHDGGPRGSGWYQLVPQEKQEAVRKLMREHRDKVQPLRDQLWIKSRTLDALSGNPNMQPKDIEALVTEMATLRTQLRDSHRAFADQVRKDTGVDLPGGFCGMKGDGPRGGYGAGYGHHGGKGRHGGGYGNGHGGRWQ